MAGIISKIIGYKGSIVFDEKRPDGTLKKLLDTSYLKNLGWTPKVDLIEGIKLTYSDFIKNSENK